MLPFPGADNVEKIVELDFLDAHVDVDEGITQNFAEFLAVGESRSEIASS